MVNTLVQIVISLLIGAVFLLGMNKMRPRGVSTQIGGLIAIGNQIAGAILVSAALIALILL